jgi:hypothetical protein
VPTCQFRPEWLDEPACNGWLDNATSEAAHGPAKFLFRLMVVKLNAVIFQYLSLQRSAAEGH